MHDRGKAKVKCTVVQALRLCTGRTAHRGSRGIALTFHDNGTRRGWGVSVTPRPFFTPGKDPVTIVQEAGWAPGPVWTGAENLAPTRIRSPDHARSNKYQIRTYLSPTDTFMQKSLTTIYEQSYNSQKKKKTLHEYPQRKCWQNPPIACIMTTLVRETSNKTFSIASNSPVKEHLFYAENIARTTYKPLSWPTLLHQRCYYGNVTCMDMAVWMLNTMFCHVTRNNRVIGTCWIFYIFIPVHFSFSCITGLYITAKKTDGPCSPLCFMHL